MKKVSDLLPEDLDLESWFGASEFRNSETETVVRNIVLVQIKIDPKVWTPFSFEDYKKSCDHKVTDSEKGVLEALTNGGKPVWNTGTSISSGYLRKDEDGNYHITEKFLGAIFKFVKE